MLAGSDSLPSGPHLHQNNHKLEFPALAGSHLALRHPALEFVKSVLEVLSLDQRIVPEVCVP